MQGFEVEMYLRAIVCDTKKSSQIASSRIASNILWPEVCNVHVAILASSNHALNSQAMILLLKNRFNLSYKSAKAIYTRQDVQMLQSLVQQ